VTALTLTEITGMVSRQVNLPPDVESFDYWRCAFSKWSIRPRVARRGPATLSGIDAAASMRS